jgi:hypothetical protein
MFTRKAKVIGIVLASLLLIWAGVGQSLESSLKSQAQETKDSNLKNLLKQKLSTLQQIASQKTAAHQAGQLSWAEVYEANRAVRDAELDLCDSNKERVAVLEKKLEDARLYEKMASEQVKLATLPTSAALEATVNRLDAEIELERAKLEE